MGKKASTQKLDRQKAKQQNQNPINPFERKVNKQKFVVAGKKLKGTEQKLGQARSKAIENVS